jgi:predicted nuclease of predicted toxin-antitoxin system
VTLWLDAQLSPALASWLAATCDVSCVPVRDLGLRDASDRDIFMAGREAGAIIATKDSDFVRLLEQLGPPPQVVWVTCGNTSNARLRELVAEAWPEIRRLLDVGEALVEISDVLA